MLKDSVSISGMSMTYMLNKALKTKKPDEPDLSTPGQPCIHTYRNCLGLCKECKWVRIDCTQCMRNKPYELLKTRMVGGPSIVFCLYAETGKSRICDHQYHNAKTCAKVVRFNVNSLYLYCSGQKMHCSKEQYVEVEPLKDLGVVQGV